MTEIAKSKRAGNKTQIAAADDADPDVLAIRALMKAQGLNRAPKADDQRADGVAAGPQSRDYSSEPIDSTAGPTTQDIKAAVGTMIAEAENAPEEETPPLGATHQSTRDQHRQTEVTDTVKRARFMHILSWLRTLSAQVLLHPKAPRVAGVVLLIVAFILHPILMIILAIVAILAAAVVVYFSVGPEAVDNYILRRFEALRKRDPGKADQLRRRAVRGIAVVSKLIDRLPTRWTAGLYLPDLEEPEDLPEKMLDDPFDRLEPVPGGQRVIRKAATTEPVLPPGPRTRKLSPRSEPPRPPRQIRP